MSEIDSFFQKMGLDYKMADTEMLEVGKDYVLYGNLTAVLESAEPDIIHAVFNNTVKVTINSAEEEKKEVVKSRVFEPGIFSITVEKKNDVQISQADFFKPSMETVFPVEVHAKQIIYGRKREHIN